MPTMYEMLSDESKAILKLEPDKKQALEKYARELEKSKRPKKKRNKAARKARRKNRKKKGR